MNLKTHHKVYPIIAVKYSRKNTVLVLKLELTVDIQGMDFSLALFGHTALSFGFPKHP